MKFELYESQIKKRKNSDKIIYQEAFSDLLDILGIKTKYASREAKTAVGEILKYLGLEVPEIPEDLKGLDTELEYMLRPSGTMKRRVELKGEWWKDNMGCLLASLKSGEIVAILPGTWSGFYYKDKHGKKIKINKKVAKNFNIDAFCFYKSFPQKKLKIRDLIWFMLKNLNMSDIAFILGFMAIGQAIAMFNVEITRFINATVIPSGQISMLASLAAILIGMMVGGTFMSLAQGFINNRFQSRLGMTVQSAVMIRMFSLPAPFFKQYTSGELSSRMGYMAVLCDMLSGQSLQTLLGVLFTSASFAQMYSFAPTLVAPAMISLGITIAFEIFIFFYQQQINRKIIKIAPKLQSLVMALFTGIQKIKTAGAEKRAFGKWAAQYSEVEKYTYSPPLILKIHTVISTLIGGIFGIVMYYLTISSNISIASYIAFGGAYGMVSGAINNLVGVALKYANIGPILEMVKPVMEAEPETSENRKIPTKLSGNIEVSDLTFKYSSDGPIILEKINLKIKKGEYIGIVGKTGCGKSTLMRLMLGFEKPVTGAIYYDGKDLNSLDLKSVRQKIGVVMQQGSLFPGDIFSNIIVTSPWKTMNDAWEAAEIAGVAEDIRNMPMGMHTVISEGSGGVSGGQKQRLMIARAIIGKPPVLFLDEATSALDNITQHHVAEKLNELDNTRIVIAHRVSTIKHCDRIIVIDSGKIAEEGSFDELMKKKGMFYDLAKRQIIEDAP